MFSAIELPKINTGTDLVVSSSNMMTTTGGAIANVEPMSPMDSLRAVFDDMRYALESIAVNTLETNNLLQRLAPTSAENRDEKINDGETDTQGNENPPDKGGTGFLDKLKSLNPFKEGLGTFGKFAIAIGALVGLKLFGENLIPSIANLLKEIKSGKLTATIKSIYLDLKDKVLIKFEELKLAIADVIKGVKTVITTVKDVYKSITDYINTFNVDGEGALNEDEKKALQKDIVKKVSGFIYDTVGEGLLAIASIFGLVKVAQIMTSIKGLGLGTAGLKAAPGAAGLLGTAALVALAAAGIYRGYQNVQFALNDSIDKETGKVDTSQFASKLLAGRNEEGGILNATINTFDKGLIGLSAGAIIGFLLGGPPGAIIGARIGSLAGSAIGAISGYIGSESFDKTLTSMGDNFTTNIDNISSAVKGVPSAYEADEQALTQDLTVMNQGLENLKAQKAQLESEGKNTSFYDRQIKRLEKTIEKQKIKVANVDVALADRMSDGKVGDIDDQIAATNKFINEMKKDMLSGGQVIDTISGGQITLDPPSQADLDAQLLIIDELKKKRQELILSYQNTDTIDTSNAEIVPENIEDKVKKAITTNESSPGHPANQNVMANVGNTYQSNAKGGDNFITGGLSSGDNFMTAVMMANKNAKMQT